ncbi:MAG TPA: thiamine pyrophosphate-dependent enzyme, partial [Acidobacteriota bacterium]|nr:thiamine pyrophosphate-dependent enzyme [Acidobacteriota bacterium]
GGNHLIHAARRNIDLTVICVNNFTYGMTGGQLTPTTPIGAMSSTTPYGNIEEPFNLPALAAVAGAAYVARWTSVHIRQTIKAMTEALRKKGFSFVEIISPCPTLYGRANKLGRGREMMRMLKDKSVIKNGADTQTVALKEDGKIVCGTFVDIEKPSFLEMYNAKMSERLGSAFKPYAGLA